MMRTCSIRVGFWIESVLFCFYEFNAHFVNVILTQIDCIKILHLTFSKIFQPSFLKILILNLSYTKCLESIKDQNVIIYFYY